MRHPHPNRDHDPLRPSDDQETYEEEIVSVTTLTETPPHPATPKRKRYKPGEPRPPRGRPKFNRLPQPQRSLAQSIAHNHIRTISNDTQHSKPAPLPHDLLPDTPDTLIPYDPIRDTRKYQAILSHPHADIIIAQLIDGQTPLLQLQHEYGIDQHQLADFARARILAPAALVARRREEESGERIIDRLSSMMDRLSKLIDAADAYLTDPADPSRYTLSPRAQEIGIVYTFSTPGPNGRPQVTRRSCRLQTLIDALETIPIDPADPPTRDTLAALLSQDPADMDLPDSRRTDQTNGRTVSPAPEPPLDQPATTPAIPQGETPPDRPGRPPHPRATPGGAAATTEDDFSVSIPFGDLAVEDLRYGGQDARKTLVEAVKGMKECLTLMGKVEGSVKPMDRMVMESPQMRAVMEVVFEVGAEYPEMVKKLTERMKGLR